MRGLKTTVQRRRSSGNQKNTKEAHFYYLISDEEFDTAICKLKANKAPGIDNILNEVLKVGKDFIKRHLKTLFSRSNPKHR